MSGCWGTPVPLGGNGGRPPVPTGAVPAGTEYEAEADAECVTPAETVLLEMLNEKEELLPVGTGLRQKSLSHQVYLPPSVALQADEIHVST